MTEEEKKSTTEKPEEKPLDPFWMTDAKEDMENYLEEQGIYIRQ